MTPPLDPTHLVQLIAWLAWQRGAYRAFTPPPPGATLTLPGERFA